MNEYKGIVIDYSRDELLSEQAMTLLKDYYMRDNEKSPQIAYARAALAYCQGDLALAQRIYDYASKQWFMFASPVLSNAPATYVNNGTTVVEEDVKALPISCFLTYVDDTLESLIEHNAEVSWLSVKGGGVGGHWSAVRAVSNKSPGVIPFNKVVDACMTAFRQGQTRKGSYASYLDVSHPDIVEFVNFKLPTGGDENRKCFNLFNAVNITDAFMEKAINGQDWELRDPNEGSVRSTIKARDLLERILDARSRTGSPYINFIDEANRQLPESQRNLGLRIHGSNLCNEIHLPTSADRTAVCCLSSVNLEQFDEWSSTTMVQDLVRFLDNVLQFFIDHAPSVLAKAKYSAMRERSIGLGAMGFHGYLQKNNLAWEGQDAKIANQNMFMFIKNEALAATLKLGESLGEAPDMVGTGRRNAHLLAIAPNANSSIICGCSPSIEPVKSNAFTHRTRAGAHLVRNKYLVKLLDSLDKNEPAVWKQIINDEGSVANLDFLTEEQKAVFKTAFELDQMSVVNHAADRQPFICQGQSVNLFFPAGSPKKYIAKVHVQAWKRKLKGLYYFRTAAAFTADKVGQSVERNALKDSEQEGK